MSEAAYSKKSGFEVVVTSLPLATLTFSPSSHAKAAFAVGTLRSAFTLSTRLPVLGSGTLARTTKPPSRRFHTPGSTGFGSIQWCQRQIHRSAMVVLLAEGAAHLSTEAL